MHELNKVIDAKAFRHKNINTYSQDGDVVDIKHTYIKTYIQKAHIKTYIQKTYVKTCGGHKNINTSSQDGDVVGTMEGHEDIPRYMTKAGFTDYRL